MDQQTLLVALVGIAGILGTLLSAVIVAKASRRAAELTNEEARRARADEALRPLVAHMLRAAEEHATQVSTQVAWRSDQNAAPLRPDGAPAIGSTEPMYVVIAEFHVLVRDLQTATAAFELYQAAVALDRWAYRPELHFTGGRVRMIDEAQHREFEQQVEAYMVVRRRFINTARAEFGRAPFPED